MIVGFGVWLIWWLALRCPGWGILGLAAFVSIAESWPLYQAFLEVRQGRRKWVKPPGYAIALYGIGSIWFVLFLTAFFIVPWFGPHAGAAFKAAEFFAAGSLVAALGLTWWVGSGR
jgi:hypothetical protein